MAGQVVRRGEEETGLERFRRSHVASLAILAVMSLMALLAAVDGAALPALGFVVIGVVATTLAWRIADPVIAIFFRWRVVAHDVGAVAPGSGVPNLSGVGRHSSGTWLRINVGGLPPDTVAEVADDIARNFGYAYADVEDDIQGQKAKIFMHRKGASGTREAWA